jgi:chromate transporter
MKPPALASLLSVFTKVGLIGFGGGSTLVPLIEKEIVQKHRWFGDPEYLRHTVAASLTPGALAVKLASAAGLDIARTRGALAAPYAVVLPGLLLMLAILSVSSVVGAAAVIVIERLSVGIFLFIVLVLALFIDRVVRGHRHPWTAVAVAAAVCLLTGGPALRRLVSGVAGVPVDGLPPVLLGLGAADAMVVVFFLVLYLGGSAGWPRRIGGSLAALAYTAACSQGLVFSGIPWLRALLLGILGLLVLSSVLSDAARAQKARTAGPRPASVLPDVPAFLPVTPRTALPVVAILLAVPGAFLLAALLFFPALSAPSGGGDATVLGYAWACLASTVSTFGGGSAYLPIAEGFFVQGGFVPHDVFYNLLVTLSNALPGPILSELAPGAGFQFALSSTGGNLLAAWIVALLGASLVVAASVLPMLAFLGFYDRLRTSPRVHALQSVVLPVVSGLLVPTALALLAGALAVLQRQGGIVPWLGAILLAIGLSLLVVLSKWRKPADVLLLAGSAGAFFLLLTLLG